MQERAERAEADSATLEGLKDSATLEWLKGGTVGLRGQISEAEQSLLFPPVPARVGQI